MNRGIRAGLGVLALLALSAPAAAKVGEATQNGFSLSWAGEASATPDRVWAELAQPARWWNKAHSWSGDARNFSMTVRQGGCFCERLPQGGFVEHARVIHAAPRQLLRLSGAFGPLQAEALVGTLTVTIKPGAAGKTSVTFDYVVGGHARMDLTRIAPVVDGVLGEQHRRLVKLVETGKAE